MNANIKARVELLLEILNEDPINDELLRKACSEKGIPEEGGIRAICWRILLNYLPLNKQEWPKFLAQHRSIYESLIQDLIVQTDQNNANGDGNGACTDHPLNSNPDSSWTKYFKDNEIVAQINKDVRRLCPEISFFQQPTEYPSKSIAENRLEPLSRRVNSVLLDSEVWVRNRSGANNLVNLKKVSTEQYATLEKGREAHWQVVERILFIYAKMNPGVKYIQGMNEILGPIYYVFASDSNPEWKKYAEADAFFCFQNLMSEIRDNFLRTMDDSSCGIGFRMRVLYDLLKERDNQLYNFMVNSQDLLPQYFAFRWISLLLSQEFLLPDVIRIWDTLFAERDRFAYLLRVCLFMLINVREQILNNDFSSNMRLLQNYPSHDMAKILYLAKESMKQNK